MTLALVCFIFWGLGIPLVIYVLMSKEKDQLDTPGALYRFGFLYNGYKRDNYFWEIIIMYRKITCLVVSVFLGSQGIIVQALVLLILLVFFMLLNDAKRPFGSRALNETESIAIFV